MKGKAPIFYWNPASQKEEEESVYGQQGLHFLYGHSVMRTLTDLVLTRPLWSRLYGAYQSSLLSRHKIQPFIKSFNVRMGEYEGENFKSFNDFFIRKFRKESRPFCETPHEMPAFAEGRFLAFADIREDQKFSIKGLRLTATELLGSAEKAKAFEGGPLVIARLCPSDYHRFHYPDDGKSLETYRIPGKLHSVNPFALQSKGDILMTNERVVSLLETRNFGKLATVEVGALCVGRIVQSHPSNTPFQRGDEKGYFLFGGSTVILVGEPGRWKPEEEILKQTQKGRETFIKLGQKIGNTTELYQANVSIAE